jgi:hypothetical protein
MREMHKVPLPITEGEDELKGERGLGVKNFYSHPCRFATFQQQIMLLE